MDVFEQINQKLSQSHIANIVQILNKHRCKIAQQFQSNTQIPSNDLLKTLLELEIDVSQHQYTFDLEKLNEQNLVNLIKLLQTPRIQKVPAQTFNVDWTALNDKRKGKLEPQKKIHQLQITNQKKNTGFNNSNLPKFGVFNQGQKQEKNKQSFFLNGKQPLKSQIPKKEEKNGPVEFMAASSLPKSVSLRKKFVPPFKKQQSDTIPEETSQNDDDEKCSNPLYKGLEKKLVDIIECEILQTTKSVKWQEIAGLDFAKKLINEMIVWPMLRPDIFTGMRAPPRGILLFGPPGTGKTMIGRAIASSAHATFFNISASSLTSKWVGQSEKLVRTLFQIARIKQPSVIFIDEIDSLLCARSQGEQQSSRRVKTQFLVELDGTKTSQNERILIIGATNLPQELDDAVRRRFIKRLYIPLPNKQSRMQLLHNLTKSDTFSIQKQEIMELASSTSGFSGADIHALCKQASMIPLRQIQEIEKIRFSQVPMAKLKHFKEALKFVRPSVNKKVLAKYEDWNEQYGSYQFNPDELEQ